MRDDMSKVLVESPRSGRAFADTVKGSRRRYRQRLDADGEGAIVHLGMRRDGGHSKHFGEHLGPLWGYLRQQVHRPWAKVYGELCAQLDRRSVVQAHLFQHIRDKVAIDTEWRDGEVWVRGGWRGPTPLGDGRQEMFVHPLTGILLPNRARVIRVRKARDEREDARRAATAHRREGLPGMPADCQWHRLDGQWYELRLGTLDRSQPKLWVYDLALRRLVGAGDVRLLSDTYGRGDRYAVAKRQLGRRELRRHGLA